MGGETTAMKALITGGGGFLGGAIVRALLERGDSVNTLQRGHYPELQRPGITVYRSDITDKDTVINAGKGCDVVFHVAAKTGVWGRYRDYYQTNVIGTEGIIEACLKNGSKRLVYTSSPSVVFHGGDEENINESAPYPQRYLNHYQATKAQAERKVLAANCKELATVALRPHLIWGPGDPHLIPRIIDRARSGRLRLVNTRSKRVDSTYLDNAVSAHLLAADVLHPGSHCSGKAYFISNGEPIPMTELVNRILAAANMPPNSKTVSPHVLYFAGAVSEIIYKLFAIQHEPMMTRFIARQLTCSHWYDLTAARRDFGYNPQISIEEGMRRLAQALNDCHDPSLEKSSV